MSGWRLWRFHVVSCVYGPGTATTPWTWIGDTRIAIGSVPTPRSLPVLRDQEAVTHVVNCRAAAQVALSGDMDMERALFGRANVAHAPMWDHGRSQDPSAWTGAAEFAARALDDPGAKILVHCQRGRRRSAMVTYAVLRLRGLSAEEASRTVLRYRREAELVPVYVANVEEWLVERGNTDDRRELGPALT